MKQKIAAAMLALGCVFSAGAASAYTAWVNGGAYLNARTGPGTRFFVETTFQPCTPLNVIGNQRGWSMIEYGAHTYWVSSAYLMNTPCGFHDHHGHGHDHHGHGHLNHHVYHGHHSYGWNYYGHHHGHYVSH